MGRAQLTRRPHLADPGNEPVLAVDGREDNVPIARVPDVLHQFDTVDLRQRQVEEDQVEFLLLEEARHSRRYGSEATSDVRTSWQRNAAKPNFSVIVLKFVKSRNLP